MELSRRGFLAASAAVPASLGAFGWPEAELTRLEATLALQPPREVTLGATTYAPGAYKPIMFCAAEHAPGKWSGYRLFRMASLDVFERACKAMPRHALQLHMADRVGMQGLTKQVCAWDRIDTGALSSAAVPFDLAAFRAHTDKWYLGQQIPRTHSSMDDGSTDAATAFRDISRVGWPQVPHGITWTATFLDEGSGLTMRALAAYDVQVDDFVLRWDVLCG